MNARAKWTVCSTSCLLLLLAASGARPAAPAELPRLKGHKEAVMAAAFSPDGKRIATASNDRTAILWDAATGQVVHRLEGHANCVTSVAFSADGARLVTGSLDRTARVWDTAKGELIAQLAGKHDQHVHAVAISPDGKQVLTGSCDHTAVLWDVDAEKPLRTFDQPGEVFSVGFAPDGRTFFAGNTGPGRGQPGKCLRVFETSSGQLTAEYDLPPVRGATFLDAGKRLLVNTGSSLWTIDLARSARPNEIHRPGMFGPMPVAWGPAPDGRTCLMEDMTGAQLVDATTGQKLRDFPSANPADAVRALAISPDGTLGLIGGGGRGYPWAGGWVPPQDTDVRVVRLAKPAVTTATPTTTAPAKGADGWVGGRPATRAAAIGPQPSGERFLLAYPGQGLKVRNLFHRPLPDGKRVLTLDTNGTYAWWDAQTGGLYGRVYTPRFATSTAVSPEMERVAAADKTGQLWIMRPGGIPAVRIPTQGNEVTHVAFAPDGKSLFSSEAGRAEDAPDLSKPARKEPPKLPKPDPAKPDPFGIYRWDPDTGKRLAEYRGAKSDVRTFLITPDGQTLVAMTEGMPDVPPVVQAWDLRTAAPLWTTAMPGGRLNEKDRRRSPHHGLSPFSPDGSLGLWVWWDVVGVFDARTGKPVSTLDRQKNAVLAAAFDPDGRRVWTAAAFDAIRGYDLRTGQLLKTVSYGEGDGEHARFVTTPKGLVAQVLTSDKEWVPRELGD